MRKTSCVEYLWTYIQEMMATMPDKITEGHKMHIFDVSIEETVTRRFVRRVTAASAKAAIETAQAVFLEKDKVMNLTEEVTCRSVFGDVVPLRSGKTSFLSIAHDDINALRKYQGPIVVGDLTINTETLATYWKGQQFHLSKQKLRVLFQLALNPDFAVSRDTILDVMTDSPGGLEDRNVDSVIKNIRSSIRTIDPDFKAIKTVGGMGYRYISGAIPYPGEDPPNDILRGPTGKPILEVDSDRLLLKFGGYFLDVSTNMIRMMVGLSSTPGRVMSRNEIISYFNGYEGEKHRSNEYTTASSILKRFRLISRKICPDIDIFRTKYSEGVSLSDEIDVLVTKF